MYLHFSIVATFLAATVHAHVRYGNASTIASTNTTVHSVPVNTHTATSAFPVSLYTAAPWIQEVDQTTIYFAETFTIDEVIITKSFGVCVPAATAYPTSITTNTVTSYVSYCPTPVLTTKTLTTTDTFSITTNDEAGSVYTTAYTTTLYATIIETGSVKTTIRPTTSINTSTSIITNGDRYTTTSCYEYTITYYETFTYPYFQPTDTAQTQTLTHPITNTRTATTTVTDSLGSTTTDCQTYTEIVIETFTYTFVIPRETAQTRTVTHPVTTTQSVTRTITDSEGLTTTDCSTYIETILETFAYTIPYPASVSTSSGFISIPSSSTSVTANPTSVISQTTSSSRASTETSSASAASTLSTIKGSSSSSSRSSNSSAVATSTTLIISSEQSETSSITHSATISWSETESPTSQKSSSITPTITTSSISTSSTSVTTLSSSTTSTSLTQSTSTTSSSTATVVSTTSSSSSSTTSAVSGNLGLCTPVSSGAAIPTVPGNVNLMQAGLNDAAYDISQSDLLAGISFPNGLECRENLVILFPGTAVPALDTYTSTFIPVFADASVADADVLVMTNPSVSLGDAQDTAEYAAFAINYAALVLGRKATIIAWSQGNLNTQWALKYWPSTRDNLKNYVGMSPDYDGTVEASFLCDPEALLTSDAATLIEDSLTDDAFGSSLEAILGIGALPTSPQQFQYYLLALLSGDVGSYMANSSSIISSSTISTSMASATTSMSSSSSSTMSSSTGTMTAGPEAQLQSNNATKRAIPFGLNPAQAEQARQVEKAIRQNSRGIVSRHVSKRQVGAGNPSALVQLLEGLAGPISEALTSLAANPASTLNEVLSNYADNLANLELPTVIPQGCLPSIWQQVYFSNFVNVLATDYGMGAGDTAFVPTTTVFSLTDEVVEPQGATGFESASGYLKGEMASNILIQGNGGCPVVASTVISGLPEVVTHEGVLYSGMGVAVAVAAVNNGGMVTVDQIDSTIRCDVVSPLLTPAQALAQEATIPGAVARIVLGGGDETLAAGFLPAEPPIKGYATVQH